MEKNSVQNSDLKYKCVFADLDKTLLDDAGRISQFTAETIETLCAAGIGFVPATGRPLCALPRELFEIRGLEFAVTSNGVAVCGLREKKPLFSLCLPPSFATSALEFLEAENVFFELFVEGQAYCSAGYHENPLAFGGSQFKTEYIRATRIPLADARKFALEHEGRIDCLNVAMAPSDRERILDAIKKEFPHVYATSSSDNLIEISNEGCGKHRGMERLCKTLGISPKECIAFGDNDNDIEMLLAAGLGIAVANSSEACLRAAKRVVESNEDGGVARELRRIFRL